MGLHFCSCQRSGLKWGVSSVLGPELGSKEPEAKRGKLESWEQELGSGIWS